MAVRVFANNTAPRITLDEGTLDTFRTNGFLAGAWTAVAVFKRAGNTNDGTQFLISASSSGSLRFGLSISSGRALEVTIGGLSCTFGASFTISNNVWYVFAVRKAAGTATPQAKLWNASTGAVIADWANGSGTLDNDTEPWDQLQLGNRVNDFPLSGKLAGCALMSASLDDTAGNTLGTGFDEWLAIGTCVAMWPLTQAATSDPVLDQVGDADETAITATSVDIGDDPAAFDLMIGGGGSAVALDGEANNAGAAIGTLSVTRPLTAHADVASAATGSASVARPLQGHADVASTASGSLSIAGTVSLEGSASAASSASGALARSVPLAGVGASAAGASGALSVRDTTPALDGVASAAGAVGPSTLEVSRGLIGTAGIAASGGADLSILRAFVPAHLSVEGSASVREATGHSGQSSAAVDGRAFTSANVHASGTASGQVEGSGSAFVSE